MMTATRKRRLSAALLALWALGVIAVTMFPIREHPRSGPHPPWWVVFQWVPFDVPPVGFVLNVVMFVPLGLLLPALWPRTGSAGRIFWWGLAASTAIESAQLLLWLTLGNFRMVDVNDLIANTGGALLGLLALRQLQRERRYDDAQARM